MHATSPPSENQLATRAAILDLTRAKLAPLFPEAGDLDALPAWLWSLPAQAIARSLILDAPFMACELALALEVDTARRYPAEAYVAHLAKHNPLLSHVQRARLAAFAYTLRQVASATGEAVTVPQMVRLGFTEDECDRLAPRAWKLIADVKEAGTPEGGADIRTPADRLRAAGELSHARRAFEEEGLEAIAAATANPAAGIMAGAAA